MLKVLAKAKPAIQRLKEYVDVQAIGWIALGVTAALGLAILAVVVGPNTRRGAKWIVAATSDNVGLVLFLLGALFLGPEVQRLSFALSAAAPLFLLTDTGNRWLSDLLWQTRGAQDSFTVWAHNNCGRVLGLGLGSFAALVHLGGGGDRGMAMLLSACYFFEMSVLTAMVINRPQPDATLAYLHPIEEMCHHAGCNRSLRLAWFHIENDARFQARINRRSLFSMLGKVNTDRKMEVKEVTVTVSQVLQDLPWTYLMPSSPGELVTWGIAVLVSLLWWWYPSLVDRWPAFFPTEPQFPSINASGLAFQAFATCVMLATFVFMMVVGRQWYRGLTASIDYARDELLALQSLLGFTPTTAGAATIMSAIGVEGMVIDWADPHSPQAWLELRRLVAEQQMQSFLARCGFSYAVLLLPFGFVLVFSLLHVFLTNRPMDPLQVLMIFPYLVYLATIAAILWAKLRNICRVAADDRTNLAALKYKVKLSLHDSKLRSVAAGPNVDEFCANIDFAIEYLTAYPAPSLGIVTIPLSSLSGGIGSLSGLAVAIASTGASMAGVILGGGGNETTVVE